ncbi:MAG: DNA-binding domain-containing protein [Myxococcota bacterium]
MSTLADEHALFWRAITWPTGVEDFLAQADEATRQAFAATFVGNDAMKAVARVNIYAESYFWRLSDVLGEQYRVLGWLLGSTRFHNFVTDFVLHRPSLSPDVRRFGAGLPDYLAEHPLQAQLGGLAELARVERAIVRAIDVPDQPRVGRAELSAVEVARWPSLRFVLADHVRVLCTTRSYPRAWAAWKAGKASPDPVPPVEPQARHWVVVWRNGVEVFHRGIVPAQAAALRIAGQGGRFEALCEAALVDDPSLEPTQIVQWLGRWLDDGLFCALDE